uniref:Uncharacterized protein n=1 Tax=Ciona savignyi TaxID=51511 RepID=H2ZDF8_CIOSA
MRLEQDSALDFTRDSSVNGTHVDSASEIFDTESRPSPDPLSSRQHLTIEEKQRLARMKEQESRMKKSGDLKPVSLVKPPANNTAHAKTKDLTSTLMQNNLHAMGPSQAKTMSSMTSQPRSSMTSQPMSSMTSQPMSSRTSQPMSFMTSQPRPSMMTQPIAPMTSQPNYNLTMMSSQSTNFTPSATHTSVVTPSNTWNNHLKHGMNGNSYGMQKSTTFPSYNGASSNQGFNGMGLNSQKNLNNVSNPFLQQNTPHGNMQTPPLNNVQNQFTSSQANCKPNNLSKQDLLDFLG